MKLRTLWNRSTDYLVEQGMIRGRADARLLCMHLMHLDYTQFIAHLEDEISQEVGDRLEGLLEKRAQGYPLQYITGKQDFMGMTFKVNENVLIPRPETEGLVEAVLHYLATERKCKSQPLSIVDVGTGSGAIAISLAVHVPIAKLFAVDISQKALDVATGNALRLGVNSRIHFVEGDLLDPVKTQAPFDVIVSNPPYVTSKEMATLQREVRYEPQLALWGGTDGLRFYRSLVKEAKHVLKPGGLIAFEIGHTLAADVKNLLLEQKWEDISVQNDLSGHARVVLAKRGKV